VHARESRSKQQLDQTVHLMWQNGLITDDEWYAYQAGGALPEMAKEPAGLPRTRGSAGRNFMTMALRHIVSELQKDANYILGGLITYDVDNPDASTARWKARSHLSTEPTVQAGT
jgi:hypothetical protein